MKKIFFGALVLFCPFMYAQTVFGLKAGYSLSNLTAKSAEGSVNYDAYSGYYLGALVERHINEKFSLQGEVLYSNIGGTFSDNSTILTPSGETVVAVKDEIRYGTLQFPLLAKYYFTEKFAALGGLNVSLIISAKSKYLESSSAEIKTDIKDRTNSFNLAPLLGLEYNVSERFFIDARYNIGISNISKISTLKGSFLQVGLGFRLPN